MVFKHDCTLLGNFKKTIAASAPRVSKTVPRWAAVWMILLCYLRREHGMSVGRYKLKYNEKRWGGGTHFQVGKKTQEAGRIMIKFGYCWEFRNKIAGISL